jgi:AraC-like DNA-binding protein
MSPDLTGVDKGASPSEQGRGEQASAESSRPAPVRVAPAPDAFAFLLQLAGTAPTLEDTVGAACAASPLWSRGPYFLSFEGQLAYVRSELPHDEDPRQALAKWLRLLAHAAGEAVAPRALYLTPEARAVLRDPLCCAIESHGWCGLAFDRAALRRPNPCADARLFEVVTEYTEARLCVLGPVQTASHEVHACLRRLHDLSRVSAPLLAGALGVGVRTLHGRLRAEGSSYRRVLDQFRMQRCLARMRAGDTSAAELATALGFPDQATFERRFRRWTGDSLRDYLRRHAAWADDAA